MSKTLATAPTKTAEEIKAEAAALKEQLSKIKEQEQAAREEAKKAREEAKAQAEQAKAKQAELTDSIKTELAEVDSEIAAAKEALETLKTKRAEIASKLPKGGGSRNGVPGTPYVPKVLTKLTKSPEIVLSILSKTKGALSRKMVFEKASEAGLLTPANVHLGRIPNTSETYADLLLSKFVTSTEAMVEEGTRTETLYSITPAGRDALKEHNKAK